MGFLRHEYWSGLPFPSPGDHPDPGTEPTSPALVGRFFTTESPGKPSGMISSVQFGSVAQSCPTLCNPMNCSTPGLPIHHQLQESTQTHFHRVSDAIQPSHPLSSPLSSCPQSLPASESFPMRSFPMSLFTSHEVAKVLKFQL